MNMFTKLFPHVRMAGRGVNGEAADTAENVARECDNRTKQAWISDRPYELKSASNYTKGKHNKLLEQMLGAFYGDAPDCIFTIGYFQEVLFWLPAWDRVSQWFLNSDSMVSNDANWRANSIPPATLAPPDDYPVKDGDVVLHIRTCNTGGMTAWHYLPYGYYDQILQHLGQSAKNSSTVWVVAPPSCAKTDFMKALQEFYDAKHVKSVGNPSDGEAAAYDFRFLVNAPTLILGKSTYGFWSGFLARNAKEVSGWLGFGLG